jgi:ketosteroid isomerase-like protein
MTTTGDEVRELGRRWADAEQHGDVDALDAMATDDFTLVGPLGFVLDRSQWLQRFRTGDLVLRSLAWDELAVHDHGDTAIVVGRHTQEGTFADRAVDGSFRATHVAVRRDDRWLLAAMHLSPIGGPPPFATPDRAS